ncbi:MAG: PKD domain-containing protein, partial [Bacteroidia bacterium]
FYNISSAGTQSGMGSMAASTYPTTTSVTVNNRPLPTGVNDLLNNCKTEHSKKMLDRFWVIGTSNYATAPVAVKKYTYVDSEWDNMAGSTNFITESLLKAWHYTATGWIKLNSTNNSVSNEETLSGNNDNGVFTLGEYRQLSISLLNVDSVKCFGQNNGIIQFSTTPGYDVNTYNWNSNLSTDTIKTNLIAGTYTIIATDGMGCSDTINNINVFEPALLSQSLTTNDYSICRNQSVQFNANYTGGTKPYTLNWSTGLVNANLNNNSTAIVITPTASLQYITTLLDKNNCLAGDTVFINVNQLPIANFDADIKTGCQPLLVNFINLSANNPKISSYQWDFLNGSFSNAVAPNYIFNAPGSYSISLIVTSDSGCVNSIRKNDLITVYGKPLADFIFSPKNDADLLDPKIDFQNASTGNYVNSLWHFGDGDDISQTNATHTFYETGLYNVTLVVSTIHNCIDSVTKQILINDIPVVFIPNAFTPLDADGLNDLFTVKGINFGSFNMMIFDRWGEKIFETSDALQGWDGKYHGKDCQVGTYTYKIALKFLNGKERGVAKFYNGHVTIVN